MNPCNHDDCIEINHGICYAQENEKNEDYRRAREALAASLWSLEGEQLLQALQCLEALDLVLADADENLN